MSCNEFVRSTYNGLAELHMAAQVAAVSCPLSSLPPCLTSSRSPSLTHSAFIAGFPQLAGGLLSPVGQEHPPSGGHFGSGPGLHTEGGGLSHQLAASRQLQLPSLNTLTAALGPVSHVWKPRRGVWTSSVTTETACSSSVSSSTPHPP